MEGCELLDHIGENGFPEHEVAGFMREIISAVKYLHSLGIVHRDIKVLSYIFYLDVHSSRMLCFATSRDPVQSN